MILTKINGNVYRLETGLPWGYTDYIDIVDEELIKQSPFGKGYYTNLMFSNLHPVDLIPVIPKINKEFEIILKKKGKNLSEEQKKHLMHALSFLYVPEYLEAIKHYNNMLKQFGIIDEGKNVAFVRIYATDNTQFNEMLNTSLTENPINKFISSAGEKLNQIPGVSTAKEYYRMLNQTFYISPQEIENIISKHSGGGIKDFIALVADASMRGLRIDFPKVWQSTEYSRTLNLSIQLSSPYGSPKALYQWVYAPLIALILLGAPMNIYGFTGVPLYVRIRAYGLSDIVLGAITSITFNRGGQNTSYNLYKQPTKFELTLTVVDLYSQFGIDYSYTKDNPFDTEEYLTEPTDYYETSKKFPTNTAQPTLLNFISSLKPYKDADMDTHLKHIEEKPMVKKKYSFRRG